MNTHTETATAEKVTSKHKYIFPNFMAKMMADVDPKTQYESAMLSSALILIGIVATSIMMIFFMQFSLTYKILIALNCLGGFLYICSSLVTVYQQYANYMDIMEIQKSMINESQPISRAQPKIKKNRKNQFIVGLGILCIAIGIGLFFTTMPFYYGAALLIVGIGFILLIIKKGKDQLKKIAKIEQLIRDGKIIPRTKSAPITVAQAPIPIRSQPVTPVTPIAPVTPIVTDEKKTLMGRLRGLTAGMKIAKMKKEQEKENEIRRRLQHTLDEIKRLKLSERRSQ
jgi:hypothetical protein